MATRTRYKSSSPIPSHPPKHSHSHDPTDALSASHFHAQYPHFTSSTPRADTLPPPQQQYYDPRFSSGSRHPPKKHIELPILSYHNAVPEPFRTQAPVGEPVPVVLPPVNAATVPPRYVAAPAAPKAPEKSRSLSIQSLISAPAVEPSYGRSGGGGGGGVGGSTAEEQHTRKRKGSDDAGDDARGTRHGSLVPTSVSIEDPDVREVVEALGGLKGDFTPTPASPPLAQAPENEPLIDLITHRAHPLLSSAITTSINTYAASKSYSASFRYAAESVENRVGLPVSNVVSAVGRRTGLDGVLRRGLQRSTTPSPATAPSSPSPRNDTNKKRKTRSDPQDTAAADANGALVTQQHQSPESQTWQKRIVLGASGLSVALNEESLKNLKYCLQWLRFLNVHLNKLVTALRSVVEELDNHRPSGSAAAASASSANGVAAASAAGPHPPLLPPIYEGQRAALTAKVEGLKAEVVNTMKKVVEVVSNYTGSALPENARDLIKRHIFSLPQRFAAASASAPASNSNQLVPGAAPGEEDHNSPRSTANRVMVLAKEGLDMMQQVSEVVEGTITRAEEWCERLGKRKKEDVEEPAPSEEEQQKRSVSWKERFEGLEERRAVRGESESDGDIRMQEGGR